jgi:hypothetical protein
VHGTRREFAAVADRAGVGRKLDRDAAFGERRGERFRREQMAAGAAGREQYQRRVTRAQAGLPATASSGGGASASMGARGRPRESASSIPMP